MRVDMLKFYSDIKVYENTLTYPVIRKQDFSRVKQQATEIAKILEMPCMRGCSVIGNKFKNEKGRYCYSFTREELHRLRENTGLFIQYLVYGTKFATDMAIHAKRLKNVICWKDTQDYYAKSKRRIQPTLFRDV